jgi:hypothetical protein
LFGLALRFGVFVGDCVVLVGFRLWFCWFGLVFGVGFVGFSVNFWFMWR